MELHTIVQFWAEMNGPDAEGRWLHPQDQDLLLTLSHTLDLRFPISPFLGDIANVPAVILGANAGFDEVETPAEFSSQAKIDSYAARVRDPATADWSELAPYYGRTRQGALVSRRIAAILNASPYRSPAIGKNGAILRKLPSTRFHRRWVEEALVPYALKGERLIIVKRPGLWKLNFPTAPSNIIVDSNPRTPSVTTDAWSALMSLSNSI